MSTPVGSSFSAGWALFKSRAGFFVGVYLLANIIMGVPYFITVALSANDQGGAAFIFNIITMIVAAIIGIGMTTIALAALDKKPLGVGLLFGNINRLGSVIVAYILFGVMVFAGMVLFVIPGIFLAVRFSMCMLFIVDKGMGPIDALKASWRATDGHFFDVFLFFLAVVGLEILGSIPLFLGLLIVVPVVMLSAAHFYRTLSSMPKAAPAAPAQV